MKPGRFLVVEDNPLNRRLIRDILRHRGHEVVEAESVDEGRIELRRQAVDVVLLDIQIPGGGGEQLLRELRGDPAVRHLPVVAVTAFAMRGDRERLLALGFNGYLSKPIDTRTFGADVERYLERTPGS
ncbi:MAG TPA: response regulator [Myxococcales bacterium]